MPVKFDPTARRAIDLAMVEVERREHGALDTPHMLIGLLEAHGNVTGLLQRLHVDLPSLQAAAEASLETGLETAPSEQTTEVGGATEEILQRASNLSRERHADMVADLDILCALVERTDTAAARVLAAHGVTTSTIDREIGTVLPEAGRRAAEADSLPAARQSVALTNRVGIGYDSHRFGGAGPLRLGGVDIPHEAGLAGHSDGDAVAHALTDAILGAAGLGDIGDMFPDNDPTNRGRDSMQMLELAAQRVRGAGWLVGQADITVIAERPRMSPHRAAMRTALAGAIGIDATRIGIKGKSNEGMGWIGRGEGIACLAVALLISAR